MPLRCAGNQRCNRSENRPGPFRPARDRGEIFPCVQIGLGKVSGTNRPLCGARPRTIASCAETRSAESLVLKYCIRLHPFSYSLSSICISLFGAIPLLRAADCGRIRNAPLRVAGAMSVIAPEDVRLPQGSLPTRCGGEPLAEGPKRAQHSNAPGMQCTCQPRAAGVTSTTSKRMAASR